MAVARLVILCEWVYIRVHSTQGKPGKSGKIGENLENLGKFLGKLKHSGKTQGKFSPSFKLFDSITIFGS